MIPDWVLKWGKLLGIAFSLCYGVLATISHLVKTGPDGKDLVGRFGVKIPTRAGVAGIMALIGATLLTAVVEEEIERRNDAADARRDSIATQRNEADAAKADSLLLNLGAANARLEATKKDLEHVTGELTRQSRQQQRLATLARTGIVDVRFAGTSSVHGGAYPTETVYVHYDLSSGHFMVHSTEPLTASELEGMCYASIFDRPFIPEPRKRAAELGVDISDDVLVLERAWDYAPAQLTFMFDFGPELQAHFLAARGVIVPSALTDDEAVKLGADAAGAIPSDPAEIALCVREGLERIAKGETT